MLNSGDPCPDPFWLIMTEQGYAVRFWFNSASIMDFRVYSAVEGSREDDKVSSWCIFTNSRPYEFDDWEEADWEIGGHIKWDGCINWETNPDCMMHGCGPRHAEEIAAIFATAFAAGARFYDYLGDAPPVMPAGVISIVEAV